MIYQQVFLIGIMTFCVVLLYGVLSVNSRSIIRHRLYVIGRVKGMKAVEGEPLSLPFRERVVKPVLERSGRLMARYAPRGLSKTVGERLVQAGHPHRLQPNTFLAVMGLAAAFMPVPALLAGLAFHLPVRSIVGLMMLASFLGLFVPWFWLARKATERIREIDLTLPDAIDLLVVSVEAGLAFDMALAKVTEKMKGPLPDEFARTLNEIRLGKIRRQALKDLTERLGSRTVSSFINTVVQSTQMGVTLGDILRIQSERVRQDRRMRASEAAMKAPVKMLFPMIFFIFPAMFVVLLGPALIRLSLTFRNL